MGQEAFWETFKTQTKGTHKGSAEVYSVFGFLSAEAYSGVWVSLAALPLTRPPPSGQLKEAGKAPRTHSDSTGSQGCPAAGPGGNLAPVCRAPHRAAPRRGRRPPLAASHHHIMALHLRLLVRQFVVLHFEAARAGGANSGLGPAQPPTSAPTRRPLRATLPLPQHPSRYPITSQLRGRGGVKELETSRGRLRTLIRAARGRDPQNPD